MRYTIQTSHKKYSSVYTSDKQTTMTPHPENYILAVCYLCLCWLPVVQSKTALLNCSKPKTEHCTARYDMIETVADLYNSSVDCNMQQKYCTCVNSQVNLLFFEMPPYIYVDKYGEVDGLMPCKYRSIWNGLWSAQSFRRTRKVGNIAKHNNYKYFWSDTHQTD